MEVGDGIRDDGERGDEKMGGEEDKVVDFKQAQLQSVMNRVIATALRENKDIITTSIKEEVTADVMRQFDAVMREKEEREEARYRRLDTVLREIQQANAEVEQRKRKRESSKNTGKIKNFLCPLVAKRWQLLYNSF